MNLASEVVLVRTQHSNCVSPAPVPWDSGYCSESESPAFLSELSVQSKVQCSSQLDGDTRSLAYSYTFRKAKGKPVKRECTGKVVYRNIVCTSLPRWPASSSSLAKLKHHSRTIYKSHGIAALTYPQGAHSKT